jgi:hypothetical protein
VGSRGWALAVADAAFGLLGDRRRRNAMASAGPRAIDGRGARRAAQAIAALVGEGTAGMAGDW